MTKKQPLKHEDNHLGSVNRPNSITTTVFNDIDIHNTEQLR